MLRKLKTFPQLDLHPLETIQSRSGWMDGLTQLLAAVELYAVNDAMTDVLISLSS